MNDEDKQPCSDKQVDTVSQFNPPVSFLSLPFFVRRKIYLLVGIVRSCPIDLNHESPQKRLEYRRYCETQLLEEIYIEPLPLEEHTLSEFCCFYQNRRNWHNVTFPGPDGIDCICMPPDLALLTVSRAIYQEVIEILYAENQFKISRTASQGLKPLFKLGREALRFMTSLHIRLNSCGCVPEHVCGPADRHRQHVLTHACGSCHYGCRCGQDLPFLLTDSDVPDMIAEWESLNKYLATRLTPGRLRLSIVCDTLGDVLPKQILSHMTQLPLLAQCAARLGQRPNNDLQWTIKTAVRQLTTQKTRTSDQHFRWNDLPVELQSEVMRQTCLVKSTKIEWAEYAHQDRPYCCGTCTKVLDTCCCPIIHAAASSKECICRSQLQSYFLVSKSFYQQALRTFFSLNTFYIEVDLLRSEDSTARQHGRGPVLEFLQTISSRGLSFLRSLSVRFIVFTFQDSRIDPLALDDWEETMRFIRDHLDLSRLNIELTTEVCNDPLKNPCVLEVREDQFLQAVIRPVRRVLQGRAKNISVGFHAQSPTSAHAERNRIREKELTSQAMGLSKLDAESVAVLRGINGMFPWEEVGNILAEVDMST